MASARGPSISRAPASAVPAELLAEAVRRLDDADVSIVDIALRRPTLDDVFIALTGHAAEEHEQAAEGAREEVRA